MPFCILCKNSKISNVIYIHSVSLLDIHTYHSYLSISTLHNFVITIIVSKKVTQLMTLVLSDNNYYVSIIQPLMYTFNNQHTAFMKLVELCDLY